MSAIKEPPKKNSDGTEVTSDLPILFPGQQEDEVILTIITPSQFQRIYGLILLSAFCGFLVLLLVFGERFLRYYELLRLYVVVGIIFVVGLWWNERAFDLSRTYLTDRRVVRIGSLFPFFERRRALFWNEVSKTKARSANFVMRIFNVGTVTIVPNFSPGENIHVPFCYYFEDLANYIDKILYLYKREMYDQIQAMHVFVPKPKGKRYP